MSQVATYRNLYRLVKFVSSFTPAAPVLLAISELFIEVYDDMTAGEFDESLQQEVASIRGSLESLAQTIKQANAPDLDVSEPEPTSLRQLEVLTVAFECVDHLTLDADRTRQAVAEKPIVFGRTGLLARQDVESQFKTFQDALPTDSNLELRVRHESGALRISSDRFYLYASNNQLYEPGQDVVITNGCETLRVESTRSNVQGELRLNRVGSIRKDEIPSIQIDDVSADSIEFHPSQENASEFTVFLIT